MNSYFDDATAEYILFQQSQGEIIEHLGLTPQQIERAELVYNRIENWDKKDVLRYRKMNVDAMKKNIFTIAGYFLGVNDLRANKRATDRALKRLDEKYISLDSLV